MDTNKLKLKPNQLCKCCKPSLFKFTSTAEVKPLKGIIGQERAVRALSFGLDMENEGYNIYLSGVFGTGKTTLAKVLLEEKAKQKSPGSDWCYVNNFQDMDVPLAIELPSGMGKVFKNDIQESMDAILSLLIKVLEGEEFEGKKNVILNVLVEETNRMYVHLEEEAREHGFTISRVQNGVSSVPLKDGEALSQDDYVSMSGEDRDDLMRRSAVVQERINEAYRRYKDVEKKTKQQITELEQETARATSDPYFEALFKKYAAYEKVMAYLKSLQADVLEKVASIVEPETETSPLQLLRQMDKRSSLRRYQVNLLVDNAGKNCAPVIFESNPSYTNLFGQIEYESEFGVLSTDFTRIRPGAIHKANGGYLVLHVYDLLKNMYVWDTLKRVIKNKEVVVESLSKNLGLTGAEMLQAEPIPVHLKVILIGEPLYYYLLYNQDEEFQKLFKIRADFDIEMDRNTRHMKDYASFIASVCESEKLRHFTPAAVARVVDYGTRMADDQSKMSTLFNKLVEIIYEANAWASYDKKTLVEEENVLKAIQEKKYRSSMIEEKIQEQIDQDTVMISVSGTKVGEVNGLAVYEMGDHRFGKPVRITAKTFMGEKGLVNIEREIHMSGSIHSKGVLTLNGYMGSQYAQEKPLTLSASLTFEQSYSGIEGDSASSTELYALLSSLGDIPIKQGIAVTGSVNQNGEIQAVGGVNHKIEGFFKVCRSKGLDGKQGVIIPRQNIKQLMLEQEIVQAVQDKIFNIWAVDHIDQGIEILTGLKSGSGDEEGAFQPGTLHDLVNEKLKKFSTRRTNEVHGGMDEDVSAAVRRRRRRR